MKKVGFLIFCLFAMCSMAGKAQDVVADVPATSLR